MSLEVKIHDTQTRILRELLFCQKSHYARLRKVSGLESDHFKFHIARLVELGYVESPEKGVYALTLRGKEYANKLDTDSNTIERQPKSGVILIIQRTNELDGEYLFQERLKQPYFGYLGFPTGKIRWGESILETANRELDEETGLTADFEHVGVWHERVYEKTSNELLEDKIFHMMLGKNQCGELKTQFEGGINTWRKRESIAGEKRFYNHLIENYFLLNKGRFREDISYYDRDKF